MEPRIQYCKTSDGVNIAYAVIGEGPPIVFASGIFGDLHMYGSGMARSRTDATNSLVERGWQVIRYDGRGSGSSERNVADFSLETRLWDLEGVVAAEQLDRFVLCGELAGGLTAITYAVRYPQRASDLVLI